MTWGGGGGCEVGREERVITKLGREEKSWASDGGPLIDGPVLWVP